MVALKEVRTKLGPHVTARAWKRELTALEDICSCRRAHMIEIIAIIEKGNQRYFMFPWAEGGNLLNFWKQNNSYEARKNITKYLIPAILEQLLGLANVLEFLHGYQDKKKKGVYRHGDLKPENILIFDHKQGCGTWTMADLGLARFHDVATRAREKPGFMATSTTAWGTTSYQPPETYLQMIRRSKPTSRLYDIWSMGCMMLQLIAWLVYGMDEIEALTRKTHNPRVMNISAFWTPYWTAGSLVPGFLVHEAVVELIGRIGRDVQGSPTLQQLLVLVMNKLLVVRLPDDSTQDVPQCRSTARGLRSSLQEIKGLCTREDWVATSLLIRGSPSERSVGPLRGPGPFQGINVRLRF